MAEKVLEKETEKFLKAIKLEFETGYSKMGDILSLSHFDNILQVKTSEDSALYDEAFDRIRELFKTSLIAKFDQMWKGQNIADSLTILEILKHKYRNQKKPQWRPSGKTATEQILPIEFGLIKKKIRYFENQLLAQKSFIEEIIPEIEENRKKFNEIFKKRERLSYQMDARLEGVENFRKSIKDLTIKVIDLD